MRPFERDKSQPGEKRISQTTPRRGTMASFRRFPTHILNHDDPEGGGGLKRKADNDDVKPAKKSKPAVQCNICFDDVKGRGTIDSCDHQFCYKCIQRWSKRSNTCPCCRARFNTIQKGDQTERVPTTDIPTPSTFHIIDELFTLYAMMPVQPGIYRLVRRSGPPAPGTINNQAELVNHHGRRGQRLTVQRHDGRGISNETAIDLVSDDEEDQPEIIESGHREEEWSLDDL